MVDRILTWERFNKNGKGLTGFQRLSAEIVRFSGAATSCGQHWRFDAGRKSLITNALDHVLQITQYTE
jgi:hypothetical protein